MKSPQETHKLPMIPVENSCLHYIIGNFKNPLVSREQLNKQRATI